MAESDKTLEDIISALSRELDPKTKGESNFFTELKGGSDIYRELEKRSEKTLADTENEDLLAMRRIWGYSVLCFIGAIVIFDMFLVTLYGLGIWKFEDSNVVIAVVAENFAKIAGLGLLITKSVFEKIFSNKVF